MSPGQTRVPSQPDDKLTRRMLARNKYTRARSIGAAVRSTYFLKKKANTVEGTTDRSIIIICRPPSPRAYGLDPRSAITIPKIITTRRYGQLIGLSVRSGNFEGSNGEIFVKIPRPRQTTPRRVIDSVI